MSPNLGIETWDADVLMDNFDAEVDPDNGGQTCRTLDELIDLFTRMEASLVQTHKEVSVSDVHDDNEEGREQCLRRIMNDLKLCRKRLAEYRLQKGGKN